MSSKLEPVIWLRVLVTLAYMKERTGRTDGRTDVHDVMAIKPIFLIDGLPYFLNYGAPRARAFGARGAPLLINICIYYMTSSVSGQDESNRAL